MSWPWRLLATVMVLGRFVALPATEHGAAGVFDIANISAALGLSSGLLGPPPEPWVRTWRYTTGFLLVAACGLWALDVLGCRGVGRGSA